jgi:hypothetical protein
VAGVVGGVECSDGEEQGMCSVGVWLCVMLTQTRVCCLRTERINCASGGMYRRTLGGRAVAGVVGGVECSDGERQCAYNVAV